MRVIQLQKLSNQSMNNSLHKSIQILLLFTSERPLLTLKEISDLTGIPKATAHRFLNTLEYNGIIQRQPEGINEFRYKLGLKFLDLGRVVAENLDIRRIAYPFMKELVRLTNDAVQLVIREDYEAIYIEKVESTLPVRLYTRIGRRAPLYAGACPRALMAFLPMPEVEKLLNILDLKPITSHTIICPSKLMDIIIKERKQGYTVSYSELAEDTVAIAMPIYDHNNQIIASLSIAGGSIRFEGKRFNYIVENLKDCVTNISKELGYTPGKNPHKLHIG